jgi:hypothetical protein
MNVEDQIQRLHQARELLRPLIEAPAEPQIEAILRSADMELHWALWNLGETLPHRHDMQAKSP